jgi:DNA polymerase-3 subunit beta
MKFTVDRDALAEAVSWVARSLPTRPVVPVLSGLLLSAGTESETSLPNGVGFLTLSCFDYEVSARIKVRAEVAEPGTVLVPGRLLVEIVRSLPGYPVEFADDPDGISVSCGEAAFTVAPLPSGEYPDLPELSELAGTADGGVLAAGIGQVTPAASKDDTLPMLTAVNLELTGETLTLAATDRYRLAVRDLPWHPAARLGKPAADEPPAAAFLVPARTLVEAARMMTQGVPVRIMMRTSGDAARPGAADPGGTDAMIGFEVGDRRLTTRLISGEFVKYRSRFPEEFDCTADLPADSFAEAVRRVSLVAERGTPVQLSFGSGRVTIAAATQGQAKARETVPADFTGGEPSIAFSPQYLLDGLTAATADWRSGTEDPGTEGPGTVDSAAVVSVSVESAAVDSAAVNSGTVNPAAVHPAAVHSGAGASGSRGSGGKKGSRTKASAAADGNAADDARGPDHGGDGGPSAGTSRVRIRFSGPSKPAVITARPGKGDDASPAFRYLVVPQRITR